MNYIKKLENEVKELRAELTGLKCGIDDIRQYLSLPKFANDTMVQVNDIFLRINDAHTLSQRLLDDQIRINGGN